MAQCLARADPGLRFPTADLSGSTGSWCAGLPPVPLHDLRHLDASLTYRATKDLKLTSQMLGHPSRAITEKGSPCGTGARQLSRLQALTRLGGPARSRQADLNEDDRSRGGSGPYG